MPLGERQVKARMPCHVCLPQKKKKKRVGFVGIIQE